jgi:hypothetical protein
LKTAVPSVALWAAKKEQNLAVCWASTMAETLAAMRVDSMVGYWDGRSAVRMVELTADRRERMKAD